MLSLIIVFVILVIWFLDVIVIAMSNDAVSLFISCIPFLASLFVLKVVLKNLVITSLIIGSVLNLSILLISLIIVVKCLMILLSS